MLAVGGALITSKGTVVCCVCANRLEGMHAYATVGCWPATKQVVAVHGSARVLHSFLFGRQFQVL